MAAKKFTALGVDIFAGLFTYGIKQAGYNVLAQLEHTNYGYDTARLNFPKLDIRIGRENWKENDFRGEVDFLYSNPPCAAWSSMKGLGQTNWSSPEERHRMDFISDIVELGLKIQPKAWCWESIPNAWLHGRDFVLEQAERLTEGGYHVTVLLQNNKYLGVPQERKRMFLIGHKHPLSWPKFSEVETVREALARAGSPRASDPTTLPLIRGHDLLWKLSKDNSGRLRQAMDQYVKDGGVYTGTRPMAVTCRLKKDKPAPVMLSAPHRLHPDKPRMLHWQEWLALCGLPPTWRSGTKLNYDMKTRELARAVMPSVGTWIGKAVMKGLTQDKLKGKPQIRLVDMLDPEHIVEEVLWTRGDTPHQRVDLTPVVKINPIVMARMDGTETKRFSGKKPNASNRPKRLGSGFRIREMLQKQWSTEKILATIKKEFPDSKATNADVSWNRRKLQLQGAP